MIKQVYLERNALMKNREYEDLLVQAYAHDNEIPMCTRSKRELTQTQINEHTLCVGSISFVRAALRQAGCVLPEHRPYPAELADMLHRQVGWHRRLSEVCARQNPIFVKPSEGWKRWTGYVLDSPYPASHRNDAVWWSEPVTWMSEFRVYVAYGKVLSIQKTPNSPNGGPLPDFNVIEEAVKRLYAAPNARQGLAVDFGVLSTGQTALIEDNDGFSIGAYGTISSKCYWQMLAARWPELVKPIPSPSQK